MTPENLELQRTPQCQYFVKRKKRLCRMTVRPGLNYCGEHSPQQPADTSQNELRIPCPNDPKHTCYVKKLAKHLKICNARQTETPQYFELNINAPSETSSQKRPLSVIPLSEISEVIDKVNLLYDKHLKDCIEVLPEKEIHHTITKEFGEEGRSESSLRHLRQASRLIHIVEEEGLAAPNTCYVELGAGKGHLSYFACNAWCSVASGSCVVLVERAALRHKRDNKIKDICLDPPYTLANEKDSCEVSENQPSQLNLTEITSKQYKEVCTRLRVDLAHLKLHVVPAVIRSTRLVGLAKHLCGVATDYSLRCLTSEPTIHKTSGILIATCCHHRCQRAGYVANKQLMELGIYEEDFNILLGIVSWATCGDGRSRERRRGGEGAEGGGSRAPGLSRAQREEVGRRAKALLDWGRVLYLIEHGFQARLVYFVSTAVSLENLCIIAKKNSE